MKTTLLISTGLACALLVSRSLAATDVAADWYAELASVQQTSSQDAGGRNRADAILRAALHSTRNGLAARESSDRSAEAPPTGANLDAAVAQAGYSVLAVLYPQSLSALDTQLAKSLAAIAADEPTIATGREWGEHVAQVVLAKQSDAVLLNASSFTQEARSPTEPAPNPEAKAEDGAIPPGRYRFSILAGEPRTRGYVDGAGTTARFDNPGGITVDRSGNVYVSEREQGTIRKISSGGVVSTLAGAAGRRGSEDGAGGAARFNVPRGLAMDAAGNILVADSGNHTIRRIDPAGAVTTLAGSPGVSGVVDGNRETARLRAPGYLAADAAGNVFVAEDDRIRKITPDGTVSTLTVKIPPYVYGYSMTFGSSPGYNLPPWPLQLCADRSGNLYAIYSDYWEYAEVVKLTPAENGEYIGQRVPTPSSYGSPPWATALAVDDDDNLYVRCLSNSVCKYTPDGMFHIYYDLEMANHYDWKDLAVDGSGNLFMLPGSIWEWPGTDHTVRTATFEPNATGPFLTKEPIDRNKYVGDAVQFSVEAVGTPAPAYQWYFNSTPISGANKATLDLPAVQMSDAGKYHVVVSDSGGSVTSRTATLTIYERIVQTPPPPPPPSSSAGAGSFDAGISLVVLALLAAAACRGRAFPDQPAA